LKAIGEGLSLVKWKTIYYSVCCFYVQQMALVVQRVLLLRATDGAGGAGFPKKHFFLPVPGVTSI
jgi:hypothetical protein